MLTRHIKTAQNASSFGRLILHFEYTSPEKKSSKSFFFSFFKKLTKTYIGTLKQLPFLDDYFLDIAREWFNELQVCPNNFGYYGTLCSFYVSVYTRRGINPQFFRG